MTFYDRPNGLTKFFNGTISFFASLGLTPSDTVTLEVAGRRTGAIHATAVTWVEHGGSRYLVSPRGETEWVRNVRAANGSAAIRRRGRKTVQLTEIEEGQRGPILKVYLDKTASATQSHFETKKGASEEEFAKEAPRHPVFRIADA